MTKEDDKVDEVIANLETLGLVEHHDNGKITIKGTREQLVKSMLGPEYLDAILADAQVYAENELAKAEDEVTRLLVVKHQKAQEIAYLEQQLGRKPVFDPEVIYFLKNPAGTEKPLAIHGKDLTKYANQGVGYTLLSLDEVAACAQEDGSANVDLFVAYEDDPAMPFEIVDPTADRIIF